MNPSEPTVDAGQLLVRDAEGQYRVADAEEVLKAARQVLSRRVRRGAAMTSPALIRDYLAVHLGALDHEVFAVMFLDAQLKLLAYKPMFRGTVSQTSVYPREIIKEALQLGSAAVVLAHNHPSGEAAPSRADEQLTQTLRQALATVDVRIIDHFIVGGATTASFAELGLL